MAFKLISSTSQAVLFVLIVGLNACGGGGGGGGNTQTNTGGISAAIITNSNVDTILAGLVESVTMSFGAVIGIPIVIDSNTGMSYTAYDLGCFSGIANLAYDLNNTNNISGQVTYVDYDNCFAVRLNGVAQLEGTLVPTSSIENVTLQLNNVQVFRLSDGQSFAISGQMDLAWRLPAGGGPVFYTLLLDLTITDVSNGYTYRFERFQVDSSLTAGTNRATLTGRFYLSEYGYVDVTTTSELKFSNFNVGPGDGSLNMRGASENAEAVYSSSFIPMITITDVL